MPRLAHGTRDEHGVWHPDNPADYPPMDVHGILPWSTLDQSAKPWQDRKKWWKQQIREDLAVRAESAGMITTGRHAAISGGVSAFDPVLAELCLTWYAPRDGFVLDPFAGGPVRGVVARQLGLSYLGVDINPAQVEANQASHPDLRDSWCNGDGTILRWLPPADYILTCPPYHNRERYTDHPDDLSTMRWERFCDRIGDAMHTCWEALKPGRFMTWVVSDVRDHHGHLRGLPAMVDSAARKAGFTLRNEQILIAPPGTRAKTMRPPWEACRTTSRRHQIVYTWVKGDRRQATKAVRHG